MTQPVIVWAEKGEPGAHPSFTCFPAGSPADFPAATLCLTNDVPTLDEALPGKKFKLVSALDLYGFVHPDRPAEELAQALAPEPLSLATLAKAWPEWANRLAAFPLWALETIELTLREIGEIGLAALFGGLAADRRHSGQKCGNWIDSFPSDWVRTERRAVPTLEDCTQLSVDRVTAPLLPGGALATLMPGYESRPGQVSMSRAIVEAFNAGHHLAVEAGTGVGKSIAYLLPAAAWAQLNDVPVVISTATRNLQAQLIEKDIPLVRKIIDAERADPETPPLKVAVLKGRTNYLCLRQLGLLLEQGSFELDRPEQRCFASLVAWAVQTPDGDLDSFSGLTGVDTAFPAKLSSVGEECPGRGCRYFRRCFLQKARALAQGAHLVIVNHSLVFADLASDAGILPPYSQLILDEAHNLEETATRHLSIEVNVRDTFQMLRRLTRNRPKRGGAAVAASQHPGGGILDTLLLHLEKGAITTDEKHAAEIRKIVRAIRGSLDAISEATHHILESFYPLVEPSQSAVRYRCDVKETTAATDADIEAPAGTLPTPVARVRVSIRHGAEYPTSEKLNEAALEAERLKLASAVKAASGGLLALGETLRQAAGEGLQLYADQADSLEGAAQTLRAFAFNVRFLLDGNSPAHIFWTEPARGVSGKGRVNLIAAPLSVAAPLADSLYQKKKSIIFCSATLRVGDSFRYIGHRLGFDLVEPERFQTCVAPSPFNYLTQCTTLAATFLPEPTGHEAASYTEQLSGLMLDVFLKTRGRALGLFTSFEMMREVARLLEAPLKEAGIRLLVHGQHGSRDQITRIFRSSEACVLLGTQSFWEGVDVPGDALSCVVVARLPFAAVGDPIVEARCEQIEENGGSSFREFSLPQAVIRLRQGFGRLIRSRSDSGVVIITDPRILTKNYGSIFVKSLPAPVYAAKDRETLLSRIGERFPQ